jgi:proteasome lid subunit RPN8/RPN11
MRMKQKAARKLKGIELRIQCEAVRQIRQHARSSMKAEICGVLIGSEEAGTTIVQASIPGAKAVQAGTHVTFTQDTWEHIYQIKDRDYPDERIVGWYHSHPGFGVFLSDHDTFIHKNFFSASQQVAWVYDPHSDEEGCFGWVGEEIARLEQIVLIDDKGGEGAGETGKPEPLLGEEEEDCETEAESTAGKSVGSSILRVVGNTLTYLLIFVAGFLLSWYLFPRVLVVPVDPHTGQPYLSAEPGSEKGASSNVPDAGVGDKSATQPEPANSAPAPQATKGKP